MIDYYTKESFPCEKDAHDFKGEGWYFWDIYSEAHGPYPDNKTAEKCRKYFDSDGENQCETEGIEFTCGDFNLFFIGFVVASFICTILHFLSIK